MTHNTAGSRPGMPAKGRPAVETPAPAATHPRLDHSGQSNDQAYTVTTGGRRTNRHRVPDTAGTVVPIHRGGYRVAEVAQLLAVPPATVYRWARANLIPARKVGRRWVIPRARFDAWVDDLPAATDADFHRERRRLDRAANRHRR
jgi:excisionase family DNA binding protein